MTTTKRIRTGPGTNGRSPTEVVITPGENGVFGKQRVQAQAMHVSAGGFTWELYRTPGDEWLQGCGNCEQDSGYKPHYSHIFDGVCFQCGGAGIFRMAGTETGMKRIIRARVSSRKSRHGAMERAAERDRAALTKWRHEHLNLASDLARIRADRDMQGVLSRMALQAERAPLTRRQEEYTIRLLALRAWEEAHPVRDVTVTFAGHVGDTVTMTGTVTVTHSCPSERFDRADTMLIVIDVDLADVRHILKTQTAAKWAFDVHKGDSITITGTIKDCKDDPNFGKQTILTRPRRVG